MLSLDKAPANEIIFNHVSTQPSGRRQPSSSRHPVPDNGHRRTKDDNQLDCVGRRMPISQTNQGTARTYSFWRSRSESRNTD